MPNWCECSLTIKGEAKELKRFKNFAKEGRRILSFNRFVPYPEDFRRRDEEAIEINKKIAEGNLSAGLRIKDGFNSGGYEWCIANWGIKWDTDDNVSVEHDDKSLIYQFDTAWSPPIPVVREMSIKFPLFTFALKYHEPGMQFKGKYKVKAGEVLSKTYTEY